jgi:hypothetical protein
MRKPHLITLNSLVNLIAVIAGLMVITIAVVNHLKRPAASSSTSATYTSGVLVGTSARPISGHDYQGTSHTLALFLDANQEDSTESAALFSQFSSAQTANPDLFRMVALFSNEENVVEASLQRWGWSVEHRSKVVPSEYQVENLPAVLVINQQGVIEKSWSGEISSAQGVDIKRALGLHVTRNVPAPVVADSSLQIYEDSKPILTVELPTFINGPPSSLSTKYHDPLYREINVFDVDKSGQIYFTYQGHIVKVDSAGKIVKSKAMPKGFQFGYCVDAQGNSYFYMGPKGIIVWSTELEQKSVIKPEGGLGEGSPLAAKMAVDRRNQQLYLQTYEPELREEQLLRVDLRSRQSSVVYHLKNAPKTIPTYGPGMFDWSIGSDRLFVSDYAEYKVTSFSLADGSQLGVFNRPFTIRTIDPEDSRLQSAGWDLPYILKFGAMVNYPAIWKVLATDDGKLLVFTSERDASNRQIVHVYDRSFQFLGTDLKHFRPGLNNHLAIGGLMYVADCSGDGKTLSSQLSPLDTPELAHQLKVFRLR